MKSDYNILIVDDIVDNIQIMMNILKEENYNLSFPTSGEKDLSLVQDTKFDIILLDIMMPGLDGFEVCESIKKISQYKNIQHK